MPGRERVGVEIDFTETGIDRIFGKLQSYLQRISQLPVGSASTGGYSEAQLAEQGRRAVQAAERRLRELTGTAGAPIPSRLAGTTSALREHLAAPEFAKLGAVSQQYDVRKLIADREVARAARQAHLDEVNEGLQKAIERANGERLQAFRAEAQATAQRVQQLRQGRLTARFGLPFDDVERAGRLQRQVRAQISKADDISTLAGESAGARDYQSARVRETRGRALLAAKIQEELAATNELAQAKSRELTARARIRERLATEQLSDRALGQEALARVRERRLAAERDIATSVATSPEDRATFATSALVQRREAAAQAQAELAQLQTAAGQQLLAAERAVTVARKREAALIEAGVQEELAVDEAYITATAAARAARAREAANITLATHGQQFRGLTDDEAIGRAAALDRAQADRRAAITARELASANTGAVRAAVDRRNAEARLRAAETAMEREYIRQAARSGALGGTLFQRLQARFSPTPRSPEEFQRFGQFVGQKTTQTIGYGIGAGLLYGGIAGISNLLKEAEKLQEVFVQIDAQLTSLGRGDQVEGVKKQVLDIARTTGVASDEVGKVAFQFVGAFGGDVSKALTETESAMKLVQVTGLELAEVVDSLTAIGKTFNVTIEDIGDVTLGLQERFGVLSKEIVTFVGDTAAVAEEAGLSFQDLAAIGAIAQQQSGKSGTVLAEQFNRIVPAINDSRVQLLSFYDTLRSEDPAKFGRSYEQLLAALGQGRTGDAFKQIVADFQELSETQRTTLISQLGGRREAQTLIAILRDSATLMGEFNGNQRDAERDAGKLEDKFAKIQETLKNTGQRLSEAFKQIGEAILASGLGEILAELGSGLALLLSGGKALLSVFSNINQAAGGVPGQLIKAVAIAALLYKAFKLVSELNIFSRGAEYLGFRAQAAGHLEVAKAAEVEAAAVSNATRADVAQAESSAAAAAANRAQASSNILSADAARVLAAGPAAQAGGRFSRFAASGAGQALFGGGGTARFNPLRGPNAAATAAGGAGASGFGIAAVAVAGALAVQSAYESNRAQIEQAGKGLREQFSKARRDRLEAITKDETSFWETLGIKLFGEDLPKDLAQRELNIRDSESGRRTIDALIKNKKVGEFTKRISAENIRKLEDQLSQGYTGVFGTLEGRGREAQDLGIGTFKQTGAQGAGRFTLDVEALKRKIEDGSLKREAEAGNETASTIVRNIDEFLKGQADLGDLRGEVDKLVNQGRIKEAIDQAGGIGNFVALQTKSVQALADVGLATEADVTDKLRLTLNQAKGVLDATPEKSGPDYEKALAEFLDIEKQFQERVFAQVKARADAARRVGELRGGDKDAQLTQTLGLLHTPGLTAPQRLELLPQALEDFQAKVDADLANIHDPVERARRELEGFDLPPEIQSLLVQQQIFNSEPFQRAAGQVAKAVGTNFGELTQNVGDIVASTDLTVKQALIKIINEKISQLLDLIDAAKARGEDVSALEAEVARLRSSGQSVEGGPDVPVDEVERAAKEQQAKERALLEKQRERTRADLEVAAALAEGNPLAEADVELQQANQDLQDALADNNDTLAQQARARVIRANKQRAKAAADIQKSYISLAAAMADGDPIREAQAQIAQGQVDLANATGEAEANSAREAIVKGGQQLRDAMVDILKSRARLAAALAGDDPLAQADAQLQQAQIDLANAKGEAAQNDAQIAFIEAQRARTRALADISKAQGELQVALAGGDPVAAAQAQLNAANIELANAQGEAERLRALAAQVQANQQLQQAYADIQRAQLELNSAQVARDPVRTAQIALQIADLQLQQAQGEAERLRAMAARIQAEHQMQDAILDIASAQSELLQAIAEAAGDSVKAAQLGLQAAQARLNALISQGAGEAEVTRARADVVRAQAAARDAQLQDRLGDIEFLQQIGDITTGQAIEMLEAVARMPDLTEQQVRDIRLKIKSLQQELSRDFQFNLPQVIQPTFYEARRFAQATAAGTTYQNTANRNTFYIDGSKDPTATANAVAGVLNELGRGGPTVSTGPTNGRY